MTISRQKYEVWNGSLITCDFLFTAGRLLFFKIVVCKYKWFYIENASNPPTFIENTSKLLSQDWLVLSVPTNIWIAENCVFSWSPTLLGIFYPIPLCCWITPRSLFVRWCATFSCFMALQYYCFFFFWRFCWEEP